MPFIMIKPLKPISFRWGGEFSPALSGPMNRGVSEPLPLPSTIVGFLYSITRGGGGRAAVGRLSIEDDLGTVGTRIWGPLLRIGDRYYAHSYPGRLIRLVNWALPADEAEQEVDVDEVLGVVNRIGIGLRMDSKTAMEHMIYSQQLIKITNGGIIVEADVNVKEGYYTMGGEGSIVKVEVVDGVNPPEKGERGLVLSPIIMEPASKVSSIEDILHNMEVKGCGRLNDIAVKVKVGLIGLGFNITYTVRRPIYPAIMPGSIINCGKRGNVGLFSDKGWGSILPIP